MKLTAAVLMLAAASCGEEGKLAVRSIPTPFAAGAHPVSFRVAEARAQFALGNVALASEGYRKALREDPASVDAFGGLAACYDQMGRFDLSRRYYESALAVAPGDTRIYASFAASLDMQGRRDEAAGIRAEMAQRLAVAAKPIETAPVAAPNVAVAAITAPVATLPVSPKPVASIAPVVVPAPVVAAPAAQLPAAPSPVAARSVTVALAPPRPAAPLKVAAVQSGPRLERLSLGEVALVTTAAPLWRAQLVDRSPRSATFGFRPLPRQANLILLNAARSRGLAARTRTYLASRGWSRIAIGDAPKVIGASTIFYPANRRSTAVRLANQFGFALRHRPSESGTLTIVLGRDAAANGYLRASRG
jgi:hypothetical protein